MIESEEMEQSEFDNFKTSCLCEVCSKCKIKNLKNFLKERDFFNSFCYNYYYDFFSNFVNPIHVILNYIEYHNYFIEKDSIRPQECCLFEKYQLIDINGSIPWCMKNHIKDCFNNWENFCNSDIINVCKEYGFTFKWGVISKPKQNTRTILFQNKMTGLYYTVLLTKKHTFTLKTLAGLKVNDHLNHKWQLESLVEQHFLPKQLADFLLNLHSLFSFEHKNIHNSQSINTRKRKLEK